MYAHCYLKYHSNSGVVYNPVKPIWIIRLDWYLIENQPLFGHHFFLRFLLSLLKQVSSLRYLGVVLKFSSVFQILFYSQLSA